jgi:glycosidase
MKDKNSIYNHYKTLLHLRNTSRALTYGDLEPVSLDNPALCAFLRQAENEAVLVVHNLSKSDITVALPEKVKAYNKVAFNNKKGSVQQASLKLPAYSTVVLKK